MVTRNQLCVRVLDIDGSKLSNAEVAMARDARAVKALIITMILIGTLTGAGLLVIGLVRYNVIPGGGPFKKAGNGAKGPAPAGDTKTTTVGTPASPSSGPPKTS